jgi:leucyl-tRNA synthetase
VQLHPLFLCSRLSQMKEYKPEDFERKWQKEWESKALYKSDESSAKPKFYILDMFPYPSGEGLHVGHPKGYIATDIVSRMKRMQGFNVLHPMGWDAFGLPAENYAIQNKVHPKVAVDKNVARFKEQLSMIGFDYDWSREVNTTDPKFYKWTQWIFLKLLEKGLAYESHEPVNWCPVDKTVLANEDLEDGKCERCGSVVEKRPIRQWVLKITDYAERLLEDLEDLDWPKSIKESQKNWIGKSEGAEIDFPVKTQTGEASIKIFTTRPDTLFGATYMVLAPEHPWVSSAIDTFENKDEVKSYIESAKNKSEMDRSALNKEKTGVELKGVKATNPATKEEIPVWVADYVLPHYGTGAIMAVPAHDERDWEFAKKYGIPVKHVVTPLKSLETGVDVFSEEGILINSGEFNGLTTEEARKKIAEKFGKLKTTYKLRDWVFSRQRYWGEPIPVMHDGEKVTPLKEEELPLTLPMVESYEPTGEAESPLAAISEWMNVKVGDKVLRRESNTMPQWAGSSWYYLRYMDPHNDEALVDKKREEYWNMVDLYVGGAEHATRHLIYARFWHKFLYDLGVVSTKEPFKRLQHVGLIIAEDGRKMSKRWGNVINPDDVIKTFGADTLRTYEMFMGPFDQSVAWNNQSMVGVRRFLEKVWRLQDKIIPGEETSSVLHQTVKKITEDIEMMKFNTSVSALMILVNDMEGRESVSQKEFETLIKILAPFAPHMTEEIWQSLGHSSSIHTEPWPKYDSQKIEENEVDIAVQINGKVRATITVSAEMTEEEVTNKATAMGEVQKWVGEKGIKKAIYVPKKILNLVLNS